MFIQRKNYNILTRIPTMSLNHTLQQLKIKKRISQMEVVINRQFSSENGVGLTSETLDNEYLLSDSCIVEQVNFNCDLRPTECSAKFRYRQKDNPVSIEYLDNGELLVRYKNVKSVTPGQACVFYQDEKCLGGGIIKEVRKNNEKLWYLL